MIERFMRILVMFDLPVETKQNKIDYTIFRRFLIQDGYDMLQFSVYSRLCQNWDQAETHTKRLKSWAPRKGAVRVLLLTNKQFADAVILTGDKKYQEKRINESQLLLF